MLNFPFRILLYALLSLINSTSLTLLYVAKSLSITILLNSLSYSNPIIPSVIVSPLIRLSTYQLYYLSNKTSI